MDDKIFPNRNTDFAVTISFRLILYRRVCAELLCNGRCHVILGYAKVAVTKLISLVALKTHVGLRTVSHGQLVPSLTCSRKHWYVDIKLTVLFGCLYIFCLFNVHSVAMDLTFTLVSYLAVSCQF